MLAKYREITIQCDEVYQDVVTLQDDYTKSPI